MKKVLVLMVMALGIPAMAASSLLDKMNEVNAKIDATQARTTQKIQAKQDEAKAQREAREAQKAAFQKKIEAQKAADKARQEELKKQIEARQAAEKAKQEAAKKKVEEKQNAFKSLFTW